MTWRPQREGGAGVRRGPGLGARGLEVRAEVLGLQASGLGWGQEAEIRGLLGRAGFEASRPEGLPGERTGRSNS